MLTMLHQNAALIVNGFLHIDRKFLLGMSAYSQSISSEITSVHPEAIAGAVIMDPVSVPLSTLPFKVMLLKIDKKGNPISEEQSKLQRLFAESILVYGGGFGSTKLCKKFSVRQILVLETDLRTRVIVSTSQVDNPFRKLVRVLRGFKSYLQDIPSMVSAQSLHCNGFPIFFEARIFNAKRLLYLDSRMSSNQIIGECELSERLNASSGNPIKLLYSGRFEPLKGALDCVKVAVECLHRGLNIELHCFGQGSQSRAMKSLANQYGMGHIFIHDTISYPELVERSRKFDVFICCHVQSDPSCTYLESFGSGLPIVGYANRMWRNLQRVSGAGFTAPIGDYSALAGLIKNYADQRELLALHSKMARAFAADHSFESEFKKRTDDINALLIVASIQ
jgi:colanic acid/amylovoran biosynthesis glycosyltransferase